MKLSLFLFVSLLSYNLVTANWLYNVARGFQEGIEDAYKNKDETIKSVKKKAVDKLGEFPLLAPHKPMMHKLMKNAGKNVEAWHNQFLKTYGIHENKQAKKNYRRNWKMINKWMGTLTKKVNDDDQKHNVPFVPHLIVEKKSPGQETRSKASKIFKNLAKMWEEDKKTKAAGEIEKNMQLLGRDEKKIQPKLDERWEELKKNAQKELPLLGAKEEKSPLLGQDEENIEPSFEKQVEFGVEKKNPFEEIKKTSENLEEKAERFVPLFKVEKDKLSHLVKDKELTPISKDELVKEAKKSAENWGKKADDSLLATKFVKEDDEDDEDDEDEDIYPSDKKIDSEGKKLESKESWSEIPVKTTMQNEDLMKTKNMFEAFETESKAKAGVKEAEKKIAKEEKFFEEAEKKWEEEMLKKSEEKPHIAEKTTEQEEIEEELKEPIDSVVTPPDEEEMPTTSPMTLPQFFFAFDKEEQEWKNQMDKKEKDQLLSVPKNVFEPASIFLTKKSEQGFAKMKEVIKPFYKDVEDAVFTKTALANDEDWKGMSKFFNKKEFKASLKAANSKRGNEEFKERSFKVPAGYIEE